jgi:hypothetical protein
MEEHLELVEGDLISKMVKKRPHVMPDLIVLDRDQSGISFSSTLNLKICNW